VPPFPAPYGRPPSGPWGPRGGRDAKGGVGRGGRGPADETERWEACGCAKTRDTRGGGPLGPPPGPLAEPSWLRGPRRGRGGSVPPGPALPGGPPPSPPGASSVRPLPAPRGPWGEGRGWDGSRGGAGAPTGGPGAVLGGPFGALCSRRAFPAAAPCVAEALPGSHPPDEESAGRQGTPRPGARPPAPVRGTGGPGPGRGGGSQGAMCGTERRGRSSRARVGPGGRIGDAHILEAVSMMGWRARRGANALNHPPGEYRRKAETQKNSRGEMNAAEPGHCNAMTRAKPYRCMYGCPAPASSGAGSTPLNRWAAQVLHGRSQFEACELWGSVLMNERNLPRGLHPPTFHCAWRHTRFKTRVPDGCAP